MSWGVFKQDGPFKVAQAAHCSSMVVEGVFQQEDCYKTVQAAYCVLALIGYVTKENTVKNRGTSIT